MTIPPEYESLSPAAVAKLLKVSITAVTQHRRRMAGLCRYCNDPALVGLTLCEVHRTQCNITGRARARSQPWKPGGRGRPPINTK